jgi:GT2 family glycosyltransferase
MNITAVVVTYNRLALLKECITAIFHQTVLPSAIIVIDNSSTDGTSEWLQQYTNLITIQQPNKGGAWGFYTGIKEAYKTGADWFWIMDDDTIPYATALEELQEVVLLTDNEEYDVFGFFASEVVWIDGSIHLMNKPQANKNFKGKQSFEFYEQRGIVPLIYNSFVSVLISREAVEKIGLPIKEFFIWNDDIEYTQRRFLWWPGKKK